MIKIEKTETFGWEAAIRGMRNPKNSWDRADSELMWTEDPSYVDIKRPDLAMNMVIGPNDMKLMKILRDAGTDHRKYLRMITVYADITAPLYWWKEFDTYKVGTVANSCSTMHKIAAKEFTLDDFSCEHLFGKEDMLPIDLRDTGPENDMALAAVSIDGSECYYTPKGLLQMTCDMLNAYRERYLAAIKTDSETGDNAKDYWWQMIQLLPSSYNQKRTVLLNYEVLANQYKSRKNHKLMEWHVYCDWIKTLPYSNLITGESVLESMLFEPASLG